MPQSFGNGFKDRVGLRYGRLTVLRRLDRRKHDSYYWLCSCDCGNEVEVFASNLGHSTNSCGCLKRDNSREMLAALKETPERLAPQTRRLPNGEAAFNRVHRTYRQNARNRHHVWELSRDETHTLVTSNCAYCGIAPQQVMASNVKPSSDTGAFLYNGIDRVDSTQGYTSVNSRSCCFVCNRAKSNMPEHAFISWVQRAAAHLKEAA